MFTPTIDNMPPDRIMRKEPFKRLLPSGALTALGSGFSTSDTFTVGGLQCVYPTYADFMQEQDCNAHRIMSPRFYPDVESYDDERKMRIIRKVARVTTNLPEVFRSQRTSMLVGDPTDLKLVSGGGNQRNQDMLAEYCEGWLYKDMDNAVYDLAWTSFGVCDCAVVLFLDGGEIGWRSMCFPKGDIIYPHRNSYGRICLFGREYKGWDGENEVAYLDVWDDRNYMRYREQLADGKKADGNEAWVVDAAPVPHNFPRCPVVYFRRNDTVAGPAMNILDHFDLAMSQLCENNKHYALRIFYALGADVDIHASIDGRPMTVTSTDTDSKVGFLEPAEASGSFELQLKQLIKSAYQAAHCTEPVEIKSGADISSLTVQMMSKDSYHQALLDAKEIQPALNDLVELFKYGWAIEVGKSSDYANLRIKGVLNPYIMRSEVEEVNNISILKGVGALPVKAAANEAAKLGYGTPRNYEEIKQEEHDALMLESQTQTQTKTAQQTATNPITASRNQ